MSCQFPTHVEDRECRCGHGETKHFLSVGKCVAMLSQSLQCPCFKFRLADREQQIHLEAERQINARLVEHYRKLAALDSIGPFTYFVQ